MDFRADRQQQKKILRQQPLHCFTIKRLHPTIKYKQPRFQPFSSVCMCIYYLKISAHTSQKKKRTPALQRSEICQEQTPFTVRPK